MPDETLRYALAFALTTGLTDWQKARLLERWGPERVVRELLPQAEGRRALERADRELLECRRMGLRVLALGDSEYPTLLTQIDDPPPVLYMWGALSSEDDLALAVVGARQASPYGLQVAEAMSHDLAGRGVTLVSGLARGIDAVAHRVALEVEGRTIAVLGSGLDRIYPREHAKLAERISRQGAVVTEQPLGAAPLPGNFPRRNRLLSGLALGTVVVEAARGSGSLITARHACDQNREVFAVPGPVGALTSEGCHDLIQRGAKLVTGAGDVLDELSPEARARLRPESVAATAPDSLTPDERRTLDALPRFGACDPDALAAAGLPTARLLAALSGLELKGLVRVFTGGNYGRSTRHGFKNV